MWERQSPEDLNQGAQVSAAAVHGACTIREYMAVSIDGQALAHIPALLRLRLASCVLKVLCPMHSCTGGGGVQR